MQGKKLKNSIKLELTALNNITLDNYIHFWSKEIIEAKFFL